MTGRGENPVPRIHRIVGVVGVAAVLLAIVLITEVVVRKDRPSPPVIVGGWSGQAMLCGYSEQPDELNELPAGEVLSLGDDPSSVLAGARCRLGSPPADDAANVPALHKHRAYFALDTGRDRYDVTLVGVDLSASRPALDAEVIVPAHGCGTTAEYRGQLMLLIEAPAGASMPNVALREVPRGC